MISTCVGFSEGLMDDRSLIKTGGWDGSFPDGWDGSLTDAWDGGLADGWDDGWDGGWYGGLTEMVEMVV